MICWRERYKSKDIGFVSSRVGSKNDTVGWCTGAGEESLKEDYEVELAMSISAM